MIVEVAHPHFPTGVRLWRKVRNPSPLRKGPTRLKEDVTAMAGTTGGPLWPQTPSL